MGFPKFWRILFQNEGNTRILNVGILPSATSTSKGVVKLSDTASSNGVSSGIAATPKAVTDAINSGAVKYSSSQALTDAQKDQARQNINVPAANTVVTLTTTQTISGSKTFSASPIVPTLGTSDSSTKVASTKFVQDTIAATAFKLDASQSLTDTQKAALVNALGSAKNSEVVHLANSETITGIKTFSTAPYSVTPATTDNSTKVATTAFVKANAYSLPTASSTVLGGIKVGSGLTISSGTLSYTLPTASSSVLGGIKVGSNLSISNGVLSATAYTLPTASASTLGGIKVGTNLSISDGVLSSTNTDTKVTSVDNHYTPSANTNSALTASVSSTGTYALNTQYAVVTGITLQRDAKGHVVGISTTKQNIKDTNTTYSFTNKAATLAWGSAVTIATVGGTDITVKLPANPNTNTLNTAGSTNSTSKLFLIGATSQAANPQTYSHSSVYETNGAMYASSFQATSDIRKKEHLEEITNVDFSSLKAYSYNFKGDDKRRIGLIAQEVEKVYPEAVSTDEDGFKSLDYNALVALLIAKINKLEEKYGE